ncbi:MAG: GNAT family N-acetyltransferase [Magnetococcales bacterium]|nr:GNAT family N-acetyltransferase [Magnetococcales bacterium]
MSKSKSLLIEPLGSQHDRKDFHSGVVDLDIYLGHDHPFGHDACFFSENLQYVRLLALNNAPRVGPWPAPWNFFANGAKKSWEKGGVKKQHGAPPHTPPGLCPGPAREPAPWTPLQNGRNDDQGQISGYYTLSAFAIAPKELPPEIAKRMPRYPVVPATLLGRLAVDMHFQGRGYGELLLLDALHRTLIHATDVATIGVIVEAKDEHAMNFYQHFAFRPFPDHPRRLFLSLATIAQLFTDSHF